VKAIVGLSNLMADAGTRIASNRRPSVPNQYQDRSRRRGLIVLNNAAPKAPPGH